MLRIAPNSFGGCYCDGLYGVKEELIIWVSCVHDHNLHPWGRVEETHLWPVHAEMEFSAKIEPHLRQGTE